MEKDKVSVNVAQEGYVATDGYTSIMFDKEGKVSSLPMYQAYGKKITQLAGKASVIYLYVIFAIVILAVIISKVILAL